MVKGIEIFRQYFHDYAGQYVLIGGTACDLLLDRENVRFRATKDLDIVLILELLDKKFVNQFIRFIEEGAYQHVNKGTGKNQYYRFSLPADPSFPAMIELFSRKPDYLTALDTRLAPIHISDDVMSLSAILLDDAYYNMLRQGAITVDHLTILGIEYLILFKMKAWLDLSLRKEAGASIDSKNIKKHKYDIIRLTVSLNPDTHLTLPPQVKKDVSDFLEKFVSEPVDLSSLGIRGISFQDITDRIQDCYEL